MTTRSIQLTRLAKHFGGTPVLKDIDLSIRAGEFLSLVGMSGCGKSTLLRLIAGLEAPDQGRVSIGDEDVTEVDPADRNLAMVFQSYALYPHMTVRQNIATPLRMRRLSALARLPLLGRCVPGRSARLREIDQAVEHAAATLEIGPLLDRRPAQLSGGQRQRVALARALVRAPAAFLMDEPLSNLDARLRDHMRDELTALHRRLGATFVYVTHDQVEAMTMSDRIALMDGGRILQVDTPEALYERPNCLAVARFIGSPTINLLAAQVHPQGQVTCYQRDSGVLTLPGHLGSAVLGVRAEDLYLTEGPGIAATVVRSERQGADRYLTLTPDAAPETRLVLRQPAGHAGTQANGARVHVAFDPTRVHLFASEGPRLPNRRAEQVAA